MDNIWNYVIMFLIGAVAGSLASKIMRTDLSLLISAILGIGGAVVGTVIFDTLKIDAGSFITKALNDSFNVNLQPGFIGRIISATVGSIVILLLVKVIRGGKRGRR